MTILLVVSGYRAFDHLANFVFVRNNLTSDYLLFAVAIKVTITWSTCQYFMFLAYDEKIRFKKSSTHFLFLVFVSNELMYITTIILSSSLK